MKNQSIVGPFKSRKDACAEALRMGFDVDSMEREPFYGGVSYHGREGSITGYYSPRMVEKECRDWYVTSCR